MSGTVSTRRAMLAGAAAGLVAFGAPRRVSAQQVVPVSCALVLAVDVSSSIDGEHWWLQRKGYADAFLQPEVIQAIRDSSKGKIAVTYFEWAGLALQRVIVPWRIVGSDDDGDEVATMLLAGGRPFEGSTGIGKALEFSMQQLDGCPYDADQKVIDVSGDGGNNDGPPPEPVRALAANNGIRVNGLPINWAMSHPPSGMTIDEYYRASVIGGPNAFALPAAGFDAFGYALAAKLRFEVS